MAHFSRVDATDERPAAADLIHLRPENARGARRALAGAAVLTTGIALSLRPGMLPWIAGQILTALGFLQAFAVLHECGHGTLFRSGRANRIVGTLAGALALIPFAAWTRVHARHHRWTGWQDLDPTTAALTPGRRSWAERTIVNVCWRLRVPVFAIAYRAANFWNVPRLVRMFPSHRDRRAIVSGVATVVAAYALLVAAVGPLTIVRVAGLALVLTFVVQDVLILSQHTHIPQQLSHGATVTPFPAPAQEVFTRSMRLPSWMSSWLLHFDAHELHHMYPFVPGYHLRRVPYVPAHEVGWWTWMRAARRLRGDVLLFQNRDESGWDL